MLNQVRLVAVTAACTLALLGSASAQQRQSDQQSGGRGQQGNITPSEVRSFMQRTENELTEAVQQGDSSAVRQWTRDHVADNASLMMMIEVGGQGRTAKSMIVSQASKQDLLRRQQMMFSLSPNMLERISNYQLGIRVQNVETLGNGAALVKVRINESGSLGGRGDREQQSFNENGGNSRNQRQRYQDEQSSSSGASSGSGNGNERGGSQSYRQASLNFDGVADCTQMLQRGPDNGQLEVGLMNCTADVNF